MPFLHFDPTGPARRLTSELGGQAARLAAQIPEPRLRQVMRSPLRRPILDALFWGLPGVLTGTRADELVSLLRCHVTGGPDGAFDAYWVQHGADGWRCGRGAPPAEPELTITVDAAELVLLATRRSSPLGAYLAGSLRASGNPLLAARLASLLKAQTPRPSV